MRKGEGKGKKERNPPNDVLSMMHREPRVTPCMFCRAIPNPVRKTKQLKVFFLTKATEKPCCSSASVASAAGHFAE
jgi:hypothetical protein